MNDATTDDTPLPFPSKKEREALILEFQRIAARLTRAGLMSRASSTRLMRAMNRERSHAEDKRHALPKLILEILLAIEDGRLEEGTHFVRDDNGYVALHLESIARAAFGAKRTSWNAREMRRLFHFGWLHFREIVSARSERVKFGPEEDRRRTVILHVAKAYEFIGGRVPSG